MLRAATKQNIQDLLDESFFGVSNFDVSYGDGKPYWLKLNFIPNANFIFQIQPYANNQYPYSVSEAPGIKLLVAETHIQQNLDHCIMRISQWINRIREEVVDANPFNRELQSVREQLEARIESLAENQEGFFSVAEANQLKQSLKEFAEKLDSVSQSNIELKEAIEKQRVRIDELIEATNSVNKGTWFRMAGSRFFSTAKAVIGSKEGREFALEAAKRVLLEGPK